MSPYATCDKSSGGGARGPLALSEIARGLVPAESSRRNSSSYPGTRRNYEESLVESGVRLGHASPSMAIHSPLEPTPEQLFLEHLPFVERAARSACRARRLGAEHTEEFVERVKEKLFENDYEVIRKFRGDKGGTLKTYLATVVNNAMLDYLNHIWGKWRPSAEAKRRGGVAIQLERLLYLEKRSFDEACEILRTNHHVDETRRDLEKLAASLPARVSRRMEGEEALADIPDPGEGADAHLLRADRTATRKRALDALQRGLALLSPEDRLIITMVSDGFTLAAIARRLGLEQKPLYRRKEQIYKTLREFLEREGIRGEEIQDILGEDPD